MKEGSNSMFILKWRGSCHVITGPLNSHSPQSKGMPFCSKGVFIHSLASTNETDTPTREHGFEFATSLCRQGLLHEALNSIQSLHVQGIRPSPFIYTYIVRRCASTKSLLAGQRVHALIVFDGLEHGDSPFAKLLVEMYGNCGCPDDAHNVFDHMQQKDLHSWNMMIAAYSYVGHGKEAFELFKEMLVEQVMPDNGTFINAFNACSNMSSLQYGRLLHAYIVANDLLVDIKTRNTLITMYGKFGSLTSARKIFADMTKKDVVTWTSIITVFAKQGHGTEALNIFAQMLNEGVKPDRVTFISTLDACAGLEVPEVGRAMHALVIEIGIELDAVIGTALLNMYGKCGFLRCAWSLFQMMPGPNVVAWNAMITAYAQYKLCKEALGVFCQMQHDGVNANKVTFISALNACAKPEDLATGKLIHHHMVEDGMRIRSDVIAGTALLSMYSECGSLDDAQRMFARLTTKNVVSWTALLSAHVEHGKPGQALTLFFEMEKKGVNPNPITFLTVLDGCANLKASTLGELVFSMIIESELKLDAFLKTSLVIMYGKCGKLEDARRIFTSIPQKNVVMYTAMIAACAQCNCGKEALCMFEQMCHEGLQPDDFTFIGILDAITGPSALADGKMVHCLIIKRNMESETSIGIALLNMYRKCGTLNDVICVFDRILTQNIVSFNAMLATYAQYEQGEVAFELFQRIRHEGLSPDHVTFISTLDACAGLIDLVQAKSLHVNLVESGMLSDVVVKTALLNMYSKCGDFKRANDIFESLSVRDVASWNSIIAAYSEHGRGKEVVELFKRMRKEGVKPDEITFGSVLTACSRAGLTKEGREYFDSMSQTYGIEPTVEHYACMADVYGRAGLLIEAQNLLKKMPSHPSPVAWLTMLSACKVHGDVQRAKHAADRVFELDPKHTGARMMLSNIYAVAGMWDEASSVLNEIT